MACTTQEKGRSRWRPSKHPWRARIVRRTGLSHGMKPTFTRHRTIVYPPEVPLKSSVRPVCIM